MKLSSCYFLEVMSKNKVLDCHTFEDIKSCLEFIDSLDYSSVEYVMFGFLT